MAENEQKDKQTEQPEEGAPANSSEAEVQDSKKEGKISGFFKKIGKKFDDATYSMRLRSDFDGSHPKYTVYGGTGILDITPEITAEEHLEEGYIITLSDDKKIAAGNLIKTPAGDVLHIAATEQVTLNVSFEEKDNELPAVKITLGEKAEEVNVIRVDDKFYIA